jgi:hypothetical protein
MNPPEHSELITQSSARLPSYATTRTLVDNVHLGGDVPCNKSGIGANSATVVSVSQIFSGGIAGRGWIFVMETSLASRAGALEGKYDRDVLALPWLPPPNGWTQLYDRIEFGFHYGAICHHCAYNSASV